MRVHELKRYGLKVTGLSQECGRDLVEIALGSEVRTLSLGRIHRLLARHGGNLPTGSHCRTELPNGAICQREEEIGAEAITHQQEVGCDALCEVIVRLV